MENIPTVHPMGNDAGTDRREGIALLAASILLGILFDLLFYMKPFGISYPIFIAAFYAVFLWITGRILTFKNRFGWALMAPIAALSCTYFIFSNDLFFFLNFLGIPLLILMQTTLVTDSGRHSWFDVRFLYDMGYAMFYRCFAYLSKPFATLAGIIRFKRETEGTRTLRKVVTGLVISIPLLLVVVGLLSSADIVFNHYASKIPELFGSLKLGDVIAQVILGFIIAVLLFSYMWSFLSGAVREKKNELEIPLMNKKIWDPVTLITILSSINIIYILFTAIQFTYLFGSINSLLPEGFTYAQYARRGFFELVAVTLLNFVLLMGTVSFTKKAGNGVDLWVKLLNSLLILCTTVMLFSAHFRMSMYEEAYGYTYLRMLTHIFMVFLFILFLVAFYRIWNEKVSLLKPYIVIALIAYMTINFMNIDGIIARNNMDRYHSTGKLDASYLTSLSYDAVPEYIGLLHDKNKEIASQVENSLYWKKETLKRYNGYWQAFNISRYRAGQLLDQYELKPAAENRIEPAGN